MGLGPALALAQFIVFVIAVVITLYCFRTMLRSFKLVAVFFLYLGFGIVFVVTSESAGAPGEISASTEVGILESLITSYPFSLTVFHILFGIIYTARLIRCRMRTPSAS